MTQSGKEAPRAPHENPEKDPDEWTTGDEPMTGAQRSYLKTLCEEARVAFDDTLTKAEASRRIDELQQKTGRGQPAHPSEEEPPPARGRGQRSEDMGGVVDELDFDGNGSRTG